MNKERPDGGKERKIESSHRSRRNAKQNGDIYTLKIKSSGIFFTSEAGIREAGSDEEMSRLVVTS